MGLGAIIFRLGAYSNTDESGRETKKREVVMKEKDIVFVSDLSKFIFHVCELRGLDPSEVLVRIGIDGGGGSEKFVANIFSPDRENQENEEKPKKKQPLDSGVKKVLVLLLCEGVPETAYNLRVMSELLQLNTCKHVIAGDLKLLNTILGISV